jgi:uncharacterized protein (TIGR03437 family)
MLKYCAFLSLCASVTLGGDFFTGQAARLVIGQTTFTSQTAGASDTLLGSANGLAFAGDTLFVADSNKIGFTPVNNRVLLFRNTSQTMPGPLASLPAYSGRCPVCVGKASLVLGQPDFVSINPHIAQTGLRTPTAVASDGRIVAIADTDNNRILIWNSIPVFNGQNADLVLGQPDFNTVQNVVVTASTFRGPQGVWIQNGKLMVADTQNNRILIWNSIPTKSNQPADVVLGQANFTTVSPIPVSDAALAPTSSTMLDPVSVTSDGIHLFVADLGYNRVLIWDTIPTRNFQTADVELGQKDFQTAVPNDAPNLCPQAGTDSSGNPQYPGRCGKSMDSPRFALSDGTRLYIADGGNDRVLIYNHIPTQSVTEPDNVLGQPDEYASVVSSTTSLFMPLLNQSAADITPTPTSLAWDGTNLYVADPGNRRILVFTPEQATIPINGVRNGASLQTYATGGVDIGGSIQAGDTVTITIQGTNYTYTVLSTDTLATIIQALVNLINAGSGDENVLAIVQSAFNQVQVTSRVGGTAGNNITLTATVSTNAQLTATTAGPTLAGGQAAGILAPGTQVSIFGTNLADQTASADTTQQLPIDLGGVEVYFDGIRSPLIYVSSTQINAQIPWEVSDGANAVNLSAFVRTQHKDGSVTVSDAVGVPITPNGNPGIYAVIGPDPRVAIAFHNSSGATGTITITGSIVAGDVGTITIEDRTYSYTVQASDTLNSVRDALISLIDSNPDEKVVASAGSAQVRIILTAKVHGPEGNGLAIAATSTNPGTNSPSLSLGVNNVTLCCANVAGAPITQSNPAQPGEIFYIFATGLGLVSDLSGNLIGPVDGTPFAGPALNTANSTVSSTSVAKTADVLGASLVVGGVGVYKVLLQLNPDIQAGPAGQVTISQDIYTSNIVTVPIGNPGGPFIPTM